MTQPAQEPGVVFKPGLQRLGVLGVQHERSRAKPVAVPGEGFIDEPHPLGLDELAEDKSPG